MSNPVLLEVLVPARNEAVHLPELLRRIHASLSDAKIPYRVLVIDDNSTDNTQEVLSQLAGQYPVQTILHKGQPGKAYAILEGASRSSAPYLAMLDADLEYPPEALPQLLALAQKNGIAVGNRKSTHNSSIRKLASKTHRFFLGQFLLGLKCDVQSGLKVFNREIIDHLDHKLIKGWAIDIPILYTAKLLGYRIVGLPIEFSPRAGSESKCRQEIVKATREIFTGALRVKFTRPTSIHIKSNLDSSVGAGIIHNRKRFITHTHLPNSLSAVKTLTGWQKFTLFAILAIFLVSFIVKPQATAIIFVGILTSIYFIDVVFNAFLIFKSLHFPPELTFSPEEVANLSEADLPIYTILCPLYKESAVLPHFAENINNLDWPKSKLDVLLLLEEDDQQTIAAAKSLNLPAYFRTLVVPHSMPKTKPKACNYGLAHAKGDYVVIYDAEDRPEADQLKKAYLGFNKSKDTVVCLQGKLNYYNPHQNLLTRLFTTEYSLWFDVMLPGLQSINTSIPLGGTSNHFKTSALKALHGWDAFNVTEDCDLGARLFKAGFTTAIIDSTTLEEANSHWGNWLRQRSRWIKGYIQTYLVHNRNPWEFIKTRGLHALIFQLVVGGKIAFMLINPFLWLATIAYFVLYSLVGPTIEALYPPIIFYMAVFSLVFGNFMFLFYYMIGAAKRGHWEIMKYVFFIPFYWLMVSLAAAKAFNQLIFRPHYWEKTNHGLHLSKKTFPALAPAVVPVQASYTPASPTAVAPAGSLVLIRSGTVLVTATIVANILNFLYNIYLGRVSDYSEYGLISLVGSILNLGQIPLLAYSRTVAHKSSFIFGKYGKPARNLWQTLRAKSWTPAFIISVAWCVATPLLTGYFHTDRALPFLIFAPLWFIGTAAAVDSGYLTGSHRFTVLALMTAVESVIKLAASIFFVSTGRNEYVYLALPASAFVSFLIGWVTAKLIKSDLVQDPDKFHNLSRPFFVSNIFSKLSSIAFLNIDVILARHYLSPSAAGEYALLSLVGKSVYFMGTVFTQFINPIVSKNEGSGKTSRANFATLLALCLCASTIGVVVFGVFGFLTVPLLFGQKTWAIVDFLPLYTLSMSAVSVGGAIVTYHQAKEKHIFAASGLIIAIAVILSIAKSHSSVEDINNIVVIGGISYLTSITILHLFSRQVSWAIRNFVDAISLFANTPVFKEPSTKNRILVLNWRDNKHTWAGGAEVYIHELAKRWVKEGHQVTLFCGNDGQCARNEVVDGVQIVRRGGFFTVYVWAAIYYLFKFKGTFDVIVEGTNGVPFFTPLYSRIASVLVIFHVNQQLFIRHLPFGLSQLARFVEGKLMPRLYKNHSIITISESSKQDIVALGFSPENISIVHPGVDVTQADTPKTSLPSFIYLGRLKPQKQVDIAISAFARLLTHYPAARLVIAGDGECRSHLERQAINLNISSSIDFLGKVSETDKAKLLTSSWVSLQPSSTEGWGITVTEANACGTPVIASNINGLKDSVVNGETGILVSSGDINALSKSMELLIVNDDLRHQLAKRAFVWAQSFNWDESAAKFMAACNSAINNHKKYYLRISTA